MLTDAALKHLKSKEKMYKVADRDGMYVAVTPSGCLIFRYDYRLNGRRETLTLGRYGDAGISLARAREKCLDARRAVAEGRSPAQEKQREKRRLKEARSFAQFGERWFQEAPMAESTRSMRRVIFDRDIVPLWKNRLLTEITPDDLRALCLKVKERGAPATAIHVRDIVKQIYGFAILHGERIKNPGDDVGPASIATFAPRDRALSPTEIGIMLRQLELVPTLPTLRLGLKLILLTMVRKGELLGAVWDEVDFENAVWSIPKERMKRGKPHNVYLSRQALDIMIALKTCAGNSHYLLPSRPRAGDRAGVRYTRWPAPRRRPGAPRRRCRQGGAGAGLAPAPRPCGNRGRRRRVPPPPRVRVKPACKEEAIEAGSRPSAQRQRSSPLRGRWHVEEVPSA